MWPEPSNGSSGLSKKNSAIKGCLVTFALLLFFSLGPAITDHFPRWIQQLFAGGTERKKKRYLRSFEGVALAVFICVRVFVCARACMCVPGIINSFCPHTNSFPFLKNLLSLSRTPNQAQFRDKRGPFKTAICVVCRLISLANESPGCRAGVLGKKEKKFQVSNKDS